MGEGLAMKGGDGRRGGRKRDGRCETRARASTCTAGDYQTRPLQRSSRQEDAKSVDADTGQRGSRSLVGCTWGAAPLKCCEDQRRAARVCAASIGCRRPCACQVALNLTLCEFSQQLEQHCTRTGVRHTTMYVSDGYVVWLLPAGLHIGATYASGQVSAARDGLLAIKLCIESTLRVSSQCVRWYLHWRCTMLRGILHVPHRRPALGLAAYNLEALSHKCIHRASSVDARCESCPTPPCSLACASRASHGRASPLRT